MDYPDRMPWDIVILIVVVLLLVCILLGLVSTALTRNKYELTPTPASTPTRTEKRAYDHLPDSFRYTV
jgi:ABC-type Fe3+ transport system permease subunit